MAPQSTTAPEAERRDIARLVSPRGRAAASAAAMEALNVRIRGSVVVSSIGTDVGTVYAADTPSVRTLPTPKYWHMHACTWLCTTSPCASLTLQTKHMSAHRVDQHVLFAEGNVETWEYKFAASQEVHPSTHTHHTHTFHTVLPPGAHGYEGFTYSMHTNALSCMCLQTCVTCFIIVSRAGE